MVIICKKQLLLRFLKIYAVVNDDEVYYLEKDRPLVISMEDASKIVASDGFHLSNSLRLGHQKKEVLYLRIQCIMDDDQLVASLILLAMSYAIGLGLDMLFMKLLSFVPILIFLYLYYVNRQKFLMIRTID